MMLTSPFFVDMKERVEGDEREPWFGWSVRCPILQLGDDLVILQPTGEAFSVPGKLPKPHRLPLRNLTLPLPLPLPLNLHCDLRAITCGILASSNLVSRIRESMRHRSASQVLLQRVILVYPVSGLMESTFLLSLASSSRARCEFSCHLRSTWYAPRRDMRGLQRGPGAWSRHVS